MTDVAYLEDLVLEQSDFRDFHIDDAAIAAFAAVSGDYNPIHMDEEFAKTTPFKGRIAHGMLMAAYISASLASYLPGVGAVYVSQTLSFKRAVRPGDDVSIVMTVRDINLKNGHVTVSTVVKLKSNNKTAVDGTAVIIAPRRPV